MTSWTIRRATLHDWDNTATLLMRAELPLAGAEEHLPDFFVAERETALIGSVGLERYSDVALLRSVAVAPTERGQGLGQELVRHALTEAASRGVRQVVLLTITASAFFPRFGFQPISRTEVPLVAQASVEFREACPASATAMSLMLVGVEN